MLDLLVIGGGPAGVAGVVQAHRTGLETLLVEQERIGGLVWNANLVENHPGLPRPLDGPAVAGLLAAHLERSGAPFEIVTVDGLRWEEGLFHAVTARSTLAARAVLLATGSRPRVLSLPGAEEARRAGLLHHEVARLPRLERGDRVLIVGGGDAAFDYALNCARQGAKATILARGTPCCLPLLRDRACATPAVELLTDVETLGIEPAANRVHLTCRPRGGETADKTFTGRYLLAAVGRDPDISLAGGVESLRPGCYDSGSAPALYLAGDAAHGRFRQISIAAGEGVLAAMHAARRIAPAKG